MDTPERVVGFFNAYRQLYPVSRPALRDIAEQFQRWLKGWSERRHIPVVEAPKGRRDDFVDPYFKGKRIPGLKLDHPRQLALMHALVRFAHVAGGNTFTTAQLRPRVLAVLGCQAERYTLASLRYDLAKLRAKGRVAKLPNSRRYQLLPRGYSICLVFLKLFERVHAPLTAGFSAPSVQIAKLISTSDRSSIASINASSMISMSSFAPSASSRVTTAPSENKIPVTDTIAV